MKMTQRHGVAPQKPPILSSTAGVLLSSVAHLLEPGYFEHGDESLGFVKVGECFDCIAVLSESLLHCELSCCAASMVIVRAQSVVTGIPKQQTGNVRITYH
jgi:hypothetical protein